MGPSSHKDFAMVNTQSDSEDGWSEEDTAHPTEKLPGMMAPHFDSHLSRTTPSFMSFF